MSRRRRHPEHFEKAPHAVEAPSAFLEQPECPPEQPSPDTFGVVAAPPGAHRVTPEYMTIGAQDASWAMVPTAYAHAIERDMGDGAVASIRYDRERSVLTAVRHPDYRKFDYRLEV